MRKTDAKERMIALAVTVGLSALGAGCEILFEKVKSAKIKKAVAEKNAADDLKSEIAKINKEFYYAMDCINAANKILDAKSNNAKEYDWFKENFKDFAERRNVEKLLKTVGDEKMRVEREREHDILSTMNEEERQAYIEYRIREAAREQGFDVD